MKKVVNLAILFEVVRSILLLFWGVAYFLKQIFVPEYTPYRLLLRSMLSNTVVLDKSRIYITVRRAYTAKDRQGRMDTDNGRTICS